jgi:Holliday junction resolvase RusA-like endonuclease
MVRLQIKPLSVNDAYRGRRFATPELKQYKTDLFRILPKLVVPDGPLSVRYVFGVSSKASDGDNLIKAFQDVVAEAYGFNDKRIYQWTIEKVDVPRGSEFVEFELSTASARHSTERSL